MKIKKQKSQPSCRIDLFKSKFIYDIAKHGNTDQYRMIMDKVKDKNPPMVFGFTPLHQAAQNGDVEMCKLIIQNIKDKNPATSSGETPKDFARIFRQWKTYELFE